MRLSWDSRHGDIDFTFVSSVFASNVIVRDVSTSVSTGQTTAVGSVRVARGETCRIAVVGRRGPVPFTLTTSFQ